jgi:hypothetical protein
VQVLMLLATVAGEPEGRGQWLVPCGTPFEALEQRSLGVASSIRAGGMATNDRQCHQVLPDGLIAPDLAQAMRLLPGVGGGLQRLGGAEVRVDGMIVGDGWMGARVVER